MPNTETIAVAMSGGVDSSAVAAMLRAEGHNLIGLTMQLWNQRRLAGKEGMPEQVTGRCCSLDDVYDARRVAQQIGIPYYVVNHEERFERDVVRPFVEEYRLRTHAHSVQPLQQSFEVRSACWLSRSRSVPSASPPDTMPASTSTKRDGRWLLTPSRRPQQGPDVFSLRPHARAAQPYALSARRHDQARGPRTRASATAWRIAEKPDSQEICFVPGGDYKRFIDAYLAEQGEALPDTAGELVTTSGEVIGEHAGIHNFTVGQRKGLGVATGSPLYVIQISGADKQVIVGERRASLHEDPAGQAREPDLRGRSARADARDRSRFAIATNPPQRRLREMGDDEIVGDLRRAAARHHTGAGCGLL